MIGKIISHCRIVAKIGAGMGEVLLRRPSVGYQIPFYCGKGGGSDGKNRGER
jgi:hypothetical protein